MEKELLFKILSRLKMFRREIVAKDMIVPMWVNDSIEEIEAAQHSVQRTACQHSDCPDHYGDPEAWCDSCKESCR